MQQSVGRQDGSSPNNSINNASVENEDSQVNMNNHNKEPVEEVDETKSEIPNKDTHVNQMNRINSLSDKTEEYIYPDDICKVASTGEEARYEKKHVHKILKKSTNKSNNVKKNYTDSEEFDHLPLSVIKQLFKASKNTLHSKNVKEE